MESRNDLAVDFTNHSTTDFSCPGQFTVISIKLLVEQQKFANPMSLRKSRIDRFNFTLDTRVDLILSREIDVVGEGDVALLGPLGNDLEADADDRRQVRTSVTLNNCFGYERRELELVLDELG